METHLSYKNLFSKLKKIDSYELTGFYDKGFIINSHKKNKDEQGRIYSVPNLKYNVTWHSHPFSDDENSFPSIEDIDTVRSNPKNIFLLLTKKGIYFMKSVDEYISVYDIFKFYCGLQSDKNSIEFDYNEIQESFLKFDNPNKIIKVAKKYGLFIFFLKKDKIIDKKIEKYIDILSLN